MADTGSVDNIVKQVFRQSLGFRYEHRRYKELARKIVASFGNEHLPSKGETSALSLRMQKTAALAYDRVWGTPPPGVPESLFFMGRTEKEVMTKTGFLINRIVRQEFSAGKLSDEDYGDIVIRTVECVLGRSWPRGKRLNRQESVMFFEEIFGRIVVESMVRKYGIIVTPIYSSVQSCNKNFTPGDHSAAIVSLQNLNIVSEEDLEWEQVIEFRKDTEARTKYRRLIHWLDKDMIGKPQTFIEDAIAFKLEDYQQAIKTHGIKTRIGLLSGIFDWSLLKGGSLTGASIAIVTGNPLWGLLSGAGCVIGNVVCKLNQAKLDIEELKQGHQEIAFVHEVKEKLGSKDKSNSSSIKKA